MASAKESENRRAIVIVIDGLGVGASPDAEEFGDSMDCNTIANVARQASLKLPTLSKLGLGNLTEIHAMEPQKESQGIVGKLEESSRGGKDTQTGHWEMMGVINDQSFPMYPQGFPEEIVERFIKEAKVPGILCNLPASGTQVLEELGEEHQKTGKPIVYTSGDSVLQIACHADTISLERQYELCEIARKIMDGPHRVGRIIARPFTGSPGNYERLSGDRRDYAVPPPEQTLLDKLVNTGYGVFGIGKIEDIFVGHGISHAVHTGSNKEGLEITLAAVQNKYPMESTRISQGKGCSDEPRLIFTNLVDTDSLYGHRRNVKGYAEALNEIDEWLTKIVAALSKDDLLIITSDHGNDPTARGTDHTREYVPVIAYSPSMEGKDLGVRKGFCDVAASVADWLSVSWNGPGKSFVEQSKSTKVA